MNTYKLTLEKRHPFIEKNGELWLFDTGSPFSYPAIALGPIPELVGVEGMAGLLGQDNIMQRRWLFDFPNGEIVSSKDPIELEGETIPFKRSIGAIPIVEVRNKYGICDAFFDTGAQISYLPHGMIKEYPRQGTYKDFYFGKEFNVPAHGVDMELGDESFTVLCSVLPEEIAKTTTRTVDVGGFVGVETMLDRKVLYSYPDQKIVFGKKDGGENGRPS